MEHNIWHSSTGEKWNLQRVENTVAQTCKRLSTTIRSSKTSSPNSQVWMSHGDTITAIPDHFRCIASTPEVKFAAYQAENEALWGVQFHPEVFHSLQGSQLLRNFVVDICGSRQDWSAASFVDSTVAELREQLGNDRVILGLSGGVDSSVAAVLLHKLSATDSLASSSTMDYSAKMSSKP